MTKPLYNYRADMVMSIDSHAFTGIGVTKIIAPTTIHIQSPVKMDRLQISTCARQDVIQNAPQTYDYYYAPVHAELEGMCPIYIEAYSKDQLTSWGFIGARNDESLQSHIDCNGQGWTYAGVSVCQTKNGLEQLMSFPVKITHFAAEPGCHATTVDNQNFRFVPDTGICHATFTDGTNWHRLILIGYHDVLIRE